ncbi:MAG TPA: hypothetical protein VHT03_12750 [Rhizomicrobium sp.]|jgi:hypothetical protein|nr:hypothetical protein [Rhizomicrobium sp.]
MPENPKTPTVVFYVMKGGNISAIKFASLVVAPDGTHWAFAKESEIDQDPHLVGAIELDPTQLAVQPSMPNGTPVFLYRTPFRDDR